MDHLTVINARAAARPETGGVERWAKELAVRLPQIRPLGYVVASPGERFSHRLGQVWEQLALPRLAESKGARAILSPANVAPLRSSCNIVVIHDVAPLRFPDDFSRAYTTWQRFLLPRIARGAMKVIVPSDFSRSELINTCEVDPRQISVVHPGVPDEVFSGGDTESVLLRYGLVRPYVLTVASKVKRKNLAALGPLATELQREGIDVVAVGGVRPHLEAQVEGSLVKQLGPVPADDLPALYSAASAFVLPSRYEGFGLPVCEAMAAGVPVVTTTAASLPEAAGGAALLVDPDDAAGLATAVQQAALNPAVRGELIAKGSERVRGLTWQSTAEKVDAVIQSAVA